MTFIECFDLILKPSNGGCDFLAFSVHGKLTGNTDTNNPLGTHLEYEINALELCLINGAYECVLSRHSIITD